MKRRFFYKIRYQLVILLFFVTIVPILCIQLLNYSRTSQMMLQQNQSLLDDNLSLTTNNLNNILGDYRQILFQISTDVTCMEGISKLDKASPDSSEYRRISDSLETVIRSNILMYPEIQGVGIISKNQIPYLYVQKREKTQTIIDFFNHSYTDLNTMILANSQAGLSCISADSPYYDSHAHYFYLWSRTLHYEKMQITGSIILFIDPERMNEAINNPKSQVYHAVNKVLTTSDGTLVCSRSGMTGFELTDLTDYQKIDFAGIPIPSESVQNNYLVSTSQLNFFNLNLYNIVNYDLLNHDIRYLWLTIFIAMGIVLVITLIIAYLSCRKFIYSIERMAEKMNQVDENHLNITIETLSRNEVRVIESSFNQMIAHINQLLTENKTQYEHILEITKRACEAELKSLELQINPHFLFNTIDSINWMAIRDNRTDISEQLNKLAYILRYTVYNMNHVVTVSEDLQWLTHYLDLQRRRFHEQFNYHIYTAPEVYPLRIHKLLLQPFLENSIIHGFENLSRQGILEIRCELLKNRFLLIRILDNGHGIPAAKLVDINLLFAKGIDHGCGVGLSNIAYRTREYYPGSRIVASSNAYGTCFRLYIPLSEMEGSYV